MLPGSLLVNRREARFPLKREVAVDVCLQQPDGQLARLSGRLLDISASGARVAVDSLPQVEGAVELRLASAELGFDLAVSAKIVWGRQVGQGCFVLGCALQPPLPSEALEPFFARMLLDRRRGTRRAMLGPAQARWEMCPDEVDVELVDVSSSGFCIRTPTPARTDGRLMLRVPAAEGTQELLANVRWQAANHDGFLVGCELVSSRGRRALRECLSVASQPPARPTSAARPLSLLALVGIVLVLAGVAAHFYVR
jgi:hypothetical protein